MVRKILLHEEGCHLYVDGTSPVAALMADPMPAVEEDLAQRKNLPNCNRGAMHIIALQYNHHSRPTITCMLRM